MVDALRDRALAEQIVDALPTRSNRSNCTVLRSVGFTLKCLRRKSKPDARKSKPDAGPWVVLVAGEHWQVTSGQRWLGQHCSLEHIAVAYNQITGIQHQMQCLLFRNQRPRVRVPVNHRISSIERRHVKTRHRHGSGPRGGVSPGVGCAVISAITFVSRKRTNRARVCLCVVCVCGRGRVRV